jgi:hypothetical protein
LEDALVHDGWIDTKQSTDRYNSFAFEFIARNAEALLRKVVE